MAGNELISYFPCVILDRLQMHRSGIHEASYQVVAMFAEGIGAPCHLSLPFDGVASAGIISVYRLFVYLVLFVEPAIERHKSVVRLIFNGFPHAFVMKPMSGPSPIIPAEPIEEGVQVFVPVTLEIRFRTAFVILSSK